jgi:crotonobetainyl-CoA:carnitine CoA-transferase CaiB-like acyl-CoA transferase
MKVLDGIKVLELGTTLTAPFAGMLLADLGADVVKIENPAGGDHFRSFRGALYSPHFIAYNKNKRSVALDIRSEEGMALLWELIDHADVLLDNFRYGVMDRLGLSWGALHARNPRLIFCSITGFGATGPYRDRPAYDTVATALTGVLGLFLDADEPRISGPTMADNAGGVFACYGILGALFERTRSDIGRRVEVNMLEAMMSFVPDSFSVLTSTGVVTNRDTRVASSQSYALRCADGKLVAIHLSSREKFWQGLVRALEVPELGTDPRFDKRMGRVDNYDALRRELNEIVQRRPRAYWIVRFEENDVPYAPINGVDEALADPQIRALETFYSAKHPTEGEVVNIRRPVLIDGLRKVADRPPPTLGEHNAEILDPGSDWRAAPIGGIATPIERRPG